jgi:hypothetical protein
MTEESFYNVHFAVTKDLHHVVKWNTVADRWMTGEGAAFTDEEVIPFPEDCTTYAAALSRAKHMLQDQESRTRDDGVKLLEEPNLWQIIDEELGITIKKDPQARQACFAIMLSAFLPKPAHLMLLGSTAIGKTWLAKNVSALIPPENVVILGSSTQRAWFYCGEPVYKPHPIIPKRQIIDFYKVVWRNKVTVILDNVKPDMIKDMKPTMSHDSPEIEIQTTEKTGSGGFRTRRVKTIGCPAFVNCSTWLQWDSELTSRHFYMTPKDSVEKYQAAADYLDQEHLTGIAPVSQMAPIIHDAIRHLIKRNLRIVIHPNVVKKLKEKFTWNSGRDVRDYERAATIVQAIAWFHALQRERNEQCQVIADERDLEIAENFLPTLLRTSHFGTSSQVLDYLERVLKPLAGLDELEVSVGRDIPQNEVTSKYLQVYGRTVTRFELYEYNKVLVTLNLIELVKDREDKRRRLIRFLRTDAQSKLT